MDSLDEIVKELPSYPKGKNESDSQIVIFDTVEKEILEKKPLFAMNKLRYFEVNTQRVVFNVKGPEQGVPYHDAEHLFNVRIAYDAKVADKAIFRLVRFVARSASPLDALNASLKECLSAYVFKHQDFVVEFNKHKPELVKLVREHGLKHGFELRPYVTHSSLNAPQGVEFIDVHHAVTAKTSDAQSVEITHDLSLTLTDNIKFSLSGVKDIKLWAREKLNQYTSNAIIDISYADVLLNLDVSIIKGMMDNAAARIGYMLKQLVSVPGQDKEKFYFETFGVTPGAQRDYSTKDQRFKIGINIVVNGRLDLRHPLTREYIKPKYDIIASMKRDVVEYATLFLLEKTPEECFLRLYELETNLFNHISRRLKENYGFRELGITIQFLENDLSKRFARLQERARKVEISGDFNERHYDLWFKVIGVAPEGWFRFRANNYATTEEEVDDIARMVKNGMEPLFADASKVDGAAIGKEFKKVAKRVQEEFGVDVKIHDFKENKGAIEAGYELVRKAELEERTMQQMHILREETDDVARLIERKKMLEQAEDHEEAAKIDKVLKNIREKNTWSPQAFLGQRSNTDFLLPPASEDTTSNEEK
jgi:hypothetical protein